MFTKKYVRGACSFHSCEMKMKIKLLSIRTYHQALKADILSLFSYLPSAQSLKGGGGHYRHYGHYFGFASTLSGTFS